MGSLAEAMFAAASQNIRDTKADPSAIAKSFASGVQLAQQHEQLQQKKAQLEKAQQGAEAKAVEGTLKVIQTAQKFKSEADQRRFIKGALPGAVKAYNTGHIFTPEMQDMLINSSDARAGVAIVESKVKSGQMTLAEGMQYLTANGLGDAVELKALQDAEQFAISERNKSIRSKDQILAAKEKAQTAFERIPEQKVKETVGKMYAEYQAQGESGVTKKLNGLKEVLQGLKDNKIKTRTSATLAIGAIPFGEESNKLSLLQPELKSAVDKVRNAISLKGALDSQFSKSEAAEVYSRAFDINGTKEQNIAKIEAMIKELESNHAAAKQLFREQGLAVKQNKATNTSPGIEGADLGPDRATEATDIVKLLPQDKVDQFVGMITSKLGQGQDPNAIFAELKAVLGPKGYTDDMLNQLMRKAQPKEPKK